MSADTNGHGPGIPAKLAKLLADKRAEVAALERVIAMLGGAAATGKAATASTVMADALALDAARRAKRRSKETTRSKSKSTVRAQRARSAEFLARLSTETPVDLKAIGVNGQSVGIAPLMNAGYVRKTKHGYLRTAKVFHVDADAEG